MLETLLGDQSSDLGAYPSQSVGGVNDQCPTCAGHRLEHCGSVERFEDSQVDDLDIYALCSQ